MARRRGPHETLIGPSRRARPAARDRPARRRSSAAPTAAGGWVGGRADRGRHSGRARSPACGSGSPPRGRSPRRSGCPRSGSAPSTRSRRGIGEAGAADESCSRSSTPGAARSSPALYDADGERLWEPFVWRPRRARRASPLGSPRPAAGRRIGGGTISATSWPAAASEIPDDADPVHRVAARHVCALAAAGAGGEAGLDPIYLRAPDAERWRERDTLQTDRVADRRRAAVRRLAYSDLPAVIAIERRSFPTPWSLAMFVLELSKPSGICLAATAGDELLGYLVCSRYDQVWHLMNVAVDPGAPPRAGSPTRLIDAPARGGRRRAAVHARGAGLQPRGDRDVRAASASARPASAPATTTTTARTR